MIGFNKFLMNVKSAAMQQKIVKALNALAQNMSPLQIVISWLQNRYCIEKKITPLWEGLTPFCLITEAALRMSSSEFEDKYKISKPDQDNGHEMLFHCGKGGRGTKAVLVAHKLGYTKYVTSFISLWCTASFSVRLESANRKKTMFWSFQHFSSLPAYVSVA